MTQAAKAPAATESGEQATATAPEDQDALDIEELARAVLDRSVRPRTATVRRLAEAVLAKGQKKGSGKSGGKPGKGKKGQKKSAKLATIPGQKDRKKG